MADPKGYITPRLSWPRTATPTDLVPAWAGEFRDFDDWVSKATTRLAGTCDPLMGREVQAICIDAIGRRCTMGAHMMRARDEGTFPVRFFWDMRPAEPDDRHAQPLLDDWWMNLECEDQRRLAERIAANVGYVLTEEPEHPDSPHARARGESSPCDEYLIALEGMTATAGEG